MRDEEGATKREVEVGDRVFAHWKAADAYFVGTAVKAREGRFLIVFEDGDIGYVDEAKIVKKDVEVGSRVFARWRNGVYYPGTVDKVVGSAFHIDYDDGDEGWVPWSGLALKEP